MKIVIQSAEELARAAAEVDRNAARAYLVSTDWMILRYAETGTPVPPDILENRARARASLSD